MSRGRRGGKQAESEVGEEGRRGEGRGGEGGKPIEKAGGEGGRGGGKRPKMVKVTEQME